MSVLEMFKGCGWSAWLAVLAGAAGLVAGVVGVAMLATKARGAAWIVGMVAALLGMGAVGVGMLGRQVGLAQIHEIVDDPGIDIDPSQRERIRIEGTKVANQCATIGASAGALPFLMGAAAIGVGLALRKRPAAA